jgi:hypothetical protein
MQEILECVAISEVKARFIEPMLLLRTDKLPEGPGWLRELKFDGYRALAIKTGDRLQLRSRNDKDFGARYPGILKALASMPDERSSTARSSPSIPRADPRSTCCRTMAAPAPRCTASSSTF